MEQGCKMLMLVRNEMLHDGHHVVAIAVKRAFDELSVTDQWSDRGGFYASVLVGPTGDQCLLPRSDSLRFGTAQTHSKGDVVPSERTG
jgi:hypothetical protein